MFKNFKEDLATFCPQKKQNNAACAAGKSALKVKNRWIKIEVDLASHDRNNALLRPLENQANSRIKATVSRKL